MPIQTTLTEPLSVSGMTTSIREASGAINITNNGTTSKYTVGDKTGMYSYQVVPKWSGESHSTFTASIQVTTHMIMTDGDTTLEMPPPSMPGAPAGE